MYSFLRLPPKSSPVVQVIVLPVVLSFHCDSSVVTYKEMKSSPSSSHEKKPITTHESLVNVARPSRKKKVHFAPLNDLASEIPIDQVVLSSPRRKSTASPCCSILKDGQTQRRLGLTPSTSERHFPGQYPSKDRNYDPTVCVIRATDALTDLLSRHDSSTELIQNILRYLDGCDFDDLELPEALYGLHRSATAMRAKLRSILDDCQCHKLSYSIVQQFKNFRDNLDYRFALLDRLIARLRELVGCKESRSVAAQLKAGSSWADCVREEAERVCEIVKQFESDTTYFINWMEECLQGKMRGELQRGGERGQGKKVAMVKKVVVVGKERSGNVEERIRRTEYKMPLVWEERGQALGSSMTKPEMYRMSRGV